MIALKIDVTKIDKTHLYQGKSAKYLDCALIENKGGPDEYGNDGFIAQSVGKAARENGERGPIIGNWREIKPKGNKREVGTSTAGTHAAPQADQTDGIPF